MTVLREFLKATIEEDSPQGDVTVDSLIPVGVQVSAQLIAKQDAVFYGVDVIRELFEIYEPQSQCQFFVEDGQRVRSGQNLVLITASHPILLLLERTCLNIVQRLSGVATQTRAFVDALANPDIACCDTRKTTPGMRFLEKKAVVAGGGLNHRYSLSDMILIKENHLAILAKTSGLDTLGEQLSRSKKQSPSLKIEIEIETNEQLESLDLREVDYILLDNYSLDALEKAIVICREKYPQAEIEVSGNVSLETIAQYQSYDIDRISIGALTHSVKAVDLSLLID